jgi:hypothetical protein
MHLLAGAYAAELSPPNGLQLFGYPHRKRLSTGVHDPLLASALVLRQGVNTQVQIALDLLFLDPPTAREVRRRVAAAVGTEERLVFISCTHTHSGPVTSPIVVWSSDPAAPPADPAYLGFVKEQIVVAAREAARHLLPAKLAWTRAPVSGVGGNRHTVDGVTDPEAGILVVRRADTGEALAVASVYGMHPTVMHEDSTLVSSDFPHYARLVLRERFGAGLVALYHNGPCGNQSPRHHVTGQTFAEAERLGRRLGGFLADAITALPDRAFAASAELDGQLRAFAPVQRVLPAVADAEQTLREYRAEFERLRAIGAARADVRTAECAVFGAEGGVALARANETGVIARLLAAYAPFEIQALRIGDGCLVGLPGEVFTDYSLEIKSARPGRVFPVAFTNGHMQGYVVTPAAAAAGGYEAAGAVLDYRTGAVMVETATRLVAALFTDP